MPTATRKKIKDAARALGYLPNPLLAALATRHFNSQRTGGTPLAYLDSPEGIRVRNDEFRNLFRHAQEHARQLGYSLELYNVTDFKDGAQATKILFSRGVQGIVVRHDFQLEMLPGMDWSRFSVVGFDESWVEEPEFPHPLLYRTAVDHFGQVLRAWNEIWKRGYRRIGFAVFDLNIAIIDDTLRWSAAQLCVQRTPHQQRVPPFILKPEDQKTEDVPELRKWLDRYRPDAVLGFNETFLGLLQRAGIQVPEDLGFASLHLNLGPEAPLPQPRPSAGMKEMRQDCLLAGVELLDQQIRHHQVGMTRRPRTVMIHSEWLDGQTLPLKAAAMAAR